MNFKKIFTFIIFLQLIVNIAAANPVSKGKFKDWEVFTASTEQGKICFAQSEPKERSPKSFNREPSRLFVTFRPNENISDEVSVTSGHTYKASSLNEKSCQNE